MARFENPHDFWGTYEGFHDGRRGRVTISDVKGDFPVPTFLVTFEDLDRDTRFRSLVQQTDRAAGRGHILRDVTLEEQGGDGSKSFALIMLHTWNTRHLTTVSRWGGREFGGSYQRVG